MTLRSRISPTLPGNINVAAGKLALAKSKNASVREFASAMVRDHEDSKNLARAKAEQAAINERTADDFESRIAAARARAGELQRNARAAQAHSGGGGTAPVSGLPATAQGAAQGAGEDRLPHADALIATEQAIQLDELINWGRAQAEVDPNGH